jgi:inner membrane protein
LEPITHFLAGACVSRAGLSRKTALATLTLTLAAEAPDIDVVVYFGDTITGFAHHRGITHTLLGVPLVAALVVGFVYLLDRLLLKRKKVAEPKPHDIVDESVQSHPLPKRWGLLYAYACLGGLLHILLDFTNQYGVRPFWPVVNRWYSWDIVFIFEPLIWIFLLGGMFLPFLFSLINEEIGARRTGFPGRTGPITALVLILLLWGVRDFQHRRAVAALDARTYHGADPVRASAFPYPLNPFVWYGIVETRDFFERMLVDSWTPEVDPQGRAVTRYKPEETPITETAKRTRLGRVYLDWARYPVAEAEQVENGYRVRFYDLRFMYPDREGRTPLGASVWLDNNLAVIAEAMGRQAERMRAAEPRRTP